MTVQQAIERANESKAGNACSDELKITWLNEIEHTIYNEVIAMHQPVPQPYSPVEDESYELVADHPYDELYVYWLMAKIDLEAQEYDKYNIDYSLFDNAYLRYQRYYHQSHLPKETPRIKVGAFSW